MRSLCKARLDKGHGKRVQEIMTVNPHNWTTREWDIYALGVRDGQAQTAADDIAMAQRQHGAACERRRKANIPWPDHGKHNPSLTVPTAGTKVEGV